MADTIYTVFQANPASSVQNDDLIYLGRSPYSSLDDFAIYFSNFYASIQALSGNNNTGAIHQLAYYAANGNALSGLATANNAILSTNGSGVPAFSSTLPAFNLGGTLNTAGQAITNSLTNGDLDFNTNGSGLFNLNSTQGISGISNDGTLAADSQYLVPTQAAVKSYVATISSGFSLVSGGPATTVSTTNFAATYNNGSSGVGATLTQSVAGVVTLNGYTPTLNDRVLFPSQTTSFQNGIYTMTTVGTVSVQAVFTRATDYDTTAQIVPGSSVAISMGTYAGSIWAQTSTITTIGTNPITFIDYAQPSNTFVTLTTAQTISGAKIFSNQIQAPSFFPTSSAGIIGRTTGVSSPSGSVGEIISSVISPSALVSFVNVTAKNLTSITLTAGNWIIWGNFFSNCAATYIVDTVAGINTTSNTLPNSSYYNRVCTTGSANVGTQYQGINVPMQAVSISTPTTYYLVGYIQFLSSSSGGANGGLYAMRIS